MSSCDDSIRRYWIEAPGAFARAYIAKWSPLRFVGSFLRKRLSVITEKLHVKPGDVLLDIGCGSGEYLAHVPRDVIALGLDYSCDMLAKAAQEIRGVPGRLLVQSDARRLPIRSSIADAVLFVAVLDYVKDTTNVLIEVMRTLKTGGRIVFTVPKSPSPFAFLRSGIGLVIREKVFQLPPIIVWLKKKEVLHIAREVGIRVESISQVQQTMWVVSGTKQL